MLPRLGTLTSVNEIVTQTVLANGLVDRLDGLKYQTIKIPTNGWVRLLDCTPRLTPEYELPENIIAQAARVSTTATSESGPNPRDHRLIRRLYEDQHTSPFEMCRFMFRIRVPMEIMTQILRHRTGNFNVMSQRYRVFDDADTECDVWGKKDNVLRRYDVPNGVRWQGPEYNHQTTQQIDYHLRSADFISLAQNVGLDGEQLLIRLSNLVTDDVETTRERMNLAIQVLRQDHAEDESKSEVIDELEQLIPFIHGLVRYRGAEKYMDEMFKIYHDLCEVGIGRECARSILPYSTYTEAQVSFDLHNLLKFLSLRCDRGEAQSEIADVADAIKFLITPLVPTVMDAFDNRMEGVSFFRDDLLYLKHGRDAVPHMSLRQRTRVDERMARLQDIP